MEKSRSPKADVPPLRPADLPLGRRALAGLLCLLTVTILFTAGTLFAKFKLDAFKTQTIRSIEARLHTELEMGPISIQGLRGLRIDGLRVAAAAENGPRLTLTAAVAYVHISLNNLLYGELTVDRIVLDGAAIRVERPAEADWYTPEGFDFEKKFSLSPGDAFRVTAQDCTLEIHNVVGDTELKLNRFSFDISRPVDAVNLSAHVDGYLGGEDGKRVSARLAFASFDDFDLRAQMDHLTAGDVNIFVPADHHLVQQGVTSPTLLISGRPGHTVTVSLEAPFEGLALRDQPEFFSAATGTLTAFGTYAREGHELTVTTARAVSDELDGLLEGSISFAGEYPVFDLSLKATRLPLEAWLDNAFDGNVSDHGTASITLNEPYELAATLRGTSKEPLLEAKLSAASGIFTFMPKDDSTPEAAFVLGAMEGTWDSTERALAGAFAIADGTVEHPGTGLRARQVSGRLTIEGQRVSMETLNAEVTGNPFTGGFWYDMGEDAGELTLNGTFAGVERYSFAQFGKIASLRGSVNLLHGKAVKNGNAYTIDAEVDGTQAELDYSFWFSKPPGVGALGDVHVDWVPGESATVTLANAEVASSPIRASGSFGFEGGEDGRWRLTAAEATSDRLDVNTIANCLTIPYTVRGGTGTSGHFQWMEHPADPGGWRIEMGARFDEVTLLAKHESATTPMAYRDATVAVTLDGGETPSGTLQLDVNSAAMPPFGSTWFTAIRPEDGAEEYQRRPWEYILSAEHLDIPPWTGTGFTGRAYGNGETSGVRQYRARIGEGEISGSYHARIAENSYTTEVQWTSVPALFFTNHLHYPKVVTGDMTGMVVYSLDRDDPGTLEGNGFFEVGEGQFSADFLYSLLQGQTENELSALPPSLEFDRLRAEVNLKGDVIKTPMLELFSKGVNIEGAGQFIRDGDMDYLINVAVAPDTAEQIPLLKENFSIRGHRLQNRDIELAFRIVGPTFAPEGQLAQLPPAMVSLVGGGLEVASEIINTPKRILLDLLRIGAGIVGAGRS